MGMASDFGTPRVPDVLVDSAISHCEKLRRILELEGWIRAAHDCPILARASVDYRLPVLYPDTVTVGATVARLGTTSYVMKYRAHSRAQSGALVAEGESVIVMLDYRNGRKVPLDDRLREAIGRLEASGRP